MSSLFFSLFVRFSVPGRFIPLFYKFHGLSSSEIGVVLSLSNFLALISTPLLSWVADTNNNHHHVIAVSQLLSLTFFLLQPLGYFLHIYPVLLLSLFATLDCAFKRPSYSIVSAIALESLYEKFGRDNGPLHFGSVRLWGAVSWAISSSLLGILMDFVDSFQPTPSISGQLNIPLLKVFYLTCPAVVFALVSNVLYKKYTTTTYSTDHFHSIEYRNEVENGTQLVTSCPISQSPIPRKEENVHYGTTGNSWLNEELSAKSPNMYERGHDGIIHNNYFPENMNGNMHNNLEQYDAMNSCAAEKEVQVMEKKIIRNTSSEQIISENRNTERDVIVMKTTDSDDGNVNILHAFYPIIFSGGMWTALFFWLMFAIGFGMNIIENLFFVFFCDELGASYTACGLSVVITVIFEIMLFAYSEKVFRIIQPPKLLIVGAFSYVVRTLGYCIIPSAYYVLALEPLHGLTYAAVHASSVAIISARTPQNYKATGQSVLSILSGASSIIGTFFGGFIIEYYGSRFLYAICSFLVFISTLSFCFIDFIE